MIPKKIHYIWLGDSELPDICKKCIESWKKYCPDFEINLWNESNININQNLFCSQAYEAKKYAFVSDYLRLKVVYEHGGIYLDTDVELIRKIDELLIYDAYFGFEQNGLLNTGLGFGSIKKTIF